MSGLVGGVYSVWRADFLRSLPLGLESPPLSRTLLVRGEYMVLQWPKIYREDGVEVTNEEIVKMIAWQHRAEENVFVRTEDTAAWPRDSCCGCRHMDKAHASPNRET